MNHFCKFTMMICVLVSNFCFASCDNTFVLYLPEVDAMLARFAHADRCVTEINIESLVQEFMREQGFLPEEIVPANNNQRNDTRIT